MRILPFFRRRRPQKDPIELINALNSKIEILETEIARLKNVGRDFAVSEAQQRADQLMTELSQSLVYSLTQISIIDRGNEVPVGDLAATARMTLESARRIGAEFVGFPGELAQFDPELHQSIQQSIIEGFSVEVRIPGLKAPSGRVVRKAVVEAR